MFLGEVVESKVSGLGEYSFCIDWGLKFLESKSKTIGKTDAKKDSTLSLSPYLSVIFFAYCKNSKDVSESLFRPFS